MYPTINYEDEFVVATKKNEPDTKEQIISYQKLRTFIGLIGFFLPFVLVLGCIVRGDGAYSWQPSISHYYYSKMHIVFVCALCVLGGFLITYKGKKEHPWESRISNFAGFCALSVATFPTQFDGFRTEANNSNLYLMLIKPVTDYWSGFHFASAGLLFGSFVLFCFVFFQQPDKKYETVEELKKFNRRKRFYKFCGWGILLSMLAIFGFYLYEKITGIDLWTYSTFCFETTSLLFFGAAWLIKGSQFWSKYPVLKTLVKSLR